MIKNRGQSTTFVKIVLSPGSFVHGSSMGDSLPFQVLDQWTSNVSWVGLTALPLASAIS
jgi:hypothetical protein